MAIAWKLLAWSFGVLAIAYVAACVGLRLVQAQLIFKPTQAVEATPERLDLPYEEVWIEVGGENSGELHAWWLPAAESESAPVLLYLHGNGGNIEDTLTRAQAFHEQGWSVLTFDYRGYGRSSPPFPSEARVYEDAEAAWRYLTQERQISPDRRVVYGHSLGGAIAIELATRQPQMAGLVVDCSFTTVVDLASRTALYGLFPLDWIVTERFASLEKVPRLAVPVLFLHGTADAVVPPDMSRTLYEATPQPKTLHYVEGAGHFNYLSDEARKQDYLEGLTQFVEAVTAPVTSSSLP